MDTKHTPTGRARAVVAAATATLALGLAACGGGDETGTAADPATDAAAGLTASDFILQLEDEKQATIEAVTAANPECDGVDTDRDFLLLVSAQATDLKPDDPVEPLIVDNCTP
ncbi:MAG: hypothetical protein U0R51_02325 [Solirubrobacterales bacterium]